MQKRFLGASGLEVSVLAFGAMNFGKGSWPGVGGTMLDDARAQVDRCLDAGVTLFDTADIYSAGESEEILGQALGARRKDVVVATKAFGTMGRGAMDRGLSRRHLIEACEASLRRLGTDWIDLYQVHAWDGRVPVEETLRALDDLVRAGKVRYLGCSNHAAWQLIKALAASDRLGLARYVGQQVQYSLIVRDIEHELIPAALDQGVGTLVWSPLAQGYLTGKYAADPAAQGRLSKSGNLAGTDSARARATVDALLAFAKARGDASPGQLAIAWLLRRPSVASILLGARSMAQLDDNLAAAAIRLSDEEMATLDEVSAPPVPYPLSHQRRSSPDRNPPLPVAIAYDPG